MFTGEFHRCAFSAVCADIVHNRQKFEIDLRPVTTESNGVAVYRSPGCLYRLKLFKLRFVIGNEHIDKAICRLGNIVFAIDHNTHIPYSLRRG